jgi:glutamyl-tRNA reductase
MSILVVGLSHRSAPLDLVERLAIPSHEVPKALGELLNGTHVAEALILSTCNRVEVYAHVTRFHGGVQEVSDLLSRISGVPLEDLSPHLYAYYEERAVQHAMSVAAGLDSMVVGEGQILGQLRDAFRTAQDEQSVGRLLHDLFRSALRVGKRARSETAIGRAGASLVSVGLQVVEAALGPVAGRQVVVVGAGAMGRLAGAALQRAGAADVVVVNRTVDTATALAAELGGRGVGLAGLLDAVAAADVVVTSTGAAEPVVPAELVEQAMARRPERPLFLLDLALPRDVDPAVRDLPGVSLADLETLRGVLEQHTSSDGDVDEVRRIVADEVADFLGSQRAMRVTPTVTALRAKADALVAAELDRLRSRLPDLDERESDEVASAVRRVVEKLLHAPTVRVKELAESAAGDAYAEALRELFELDPQVPAAVRVADLPLTDGDLA